MSPVKGGITEASCISYGRCHELTSNYSFCGWLEQTFGGGEHERELIETLCVLTEGLISFVASSFIGNTLYCSGDMLCIE